MGGNISPNERLGMISPIRPDSRRAARVANVPAHIFFYMVSGGWANEPLDDDELPDEFQVDWFRVWQRDDLK